MSGTTSLSSLPSGDGSNSHSAVQNNANVQLAIHDGGPAASGGSAVDGKEASELVRSVQEASQAGGLNMPIAQPATTSAPVESARVPPVNANPAVQHAPAPQPQVAQQPVTHSTAQPGHTFQWVEYAQGPIIAFAAYILFQTPQIHKSIGNLIPMAKKVDGKMSSAGHIVNAAFFGAIYFWISQVASHLI